MKVTILANYKSFQFHTEDIGLNFADKTELGK